MVIGVDEVGRGCWAGPLLAAAVGFTKKFNIDGLNDSKLLSKNKRLTFDQYIRDSTTVIGVGWVWPEEINHLGLSKSIRLAMERALGRIIYSPENRVIIDGNINYLAHLPSCEAIVKADGSIAEVSAASIIAKVARDNYMATIAQDYPGYGFEKHVGYGTKFHLNALSEHGVTDLHRTNYKPIAKLLAR